MYLLLNLHQLCLVGGQIKKRDRNKSNEGSDKLEQNRVKQSYPKESKIRLRKTWKI